MCILMVPAILISSALTSEPDALPTYTVLRASEQLVIDGKMDESCWQSAPPVGDFVFPWWTEGEKEPTVARLLWDDENLYVCFVAYDKHISAVHTDRDAPVSEDDCVEVFIAPNPERVKDYFNFEINALGALLDRSPLDNRSKDWNAEGIRIGITIDGTLNDERDEDRAWTVEMAIPFAVFTGFARAIPPADGDAWRLNLYRTGGKVNPQYSAWSNPAAARPSFHVPERFGVVVFSTRVVPSAQSGPVQGERHESPSDS